jgi:hypothetical protein
MPSRRKLWRTRFAFPGAPNHQHESQAAAYRWVREQVRNRENRRCKQLTVFVDERDGQGYQTYERLDLDELAAAEAGDPS